MIIPRCGDIFEDPTLLFPGVADRRYLEPMYDRVNQEIRKYDEEHIILFAGVSATAGYISLSLQLQANEAK